MLKRIMRSTVHKQETLRIEFKWVPFIVFACGSADVHCGRVVFKSIYYDLLQCFLQNHPQRMSANQSFVCKNFLQTMCVDLQTPLNRE